MRITDNRDTDADSIPDELKEIGCQGKIGKKRVRPSALKLPG